MTEYKYTKHIWTKDNDLVLPAERTLAYMSYNSPGQPLVEGLFNTVKEVNEYESLDTPQKKFSYLIDRLVDRSTEYLNITDSDLWGHTFLPHMGVGMGTRETLSRHIFIFRSSIFIHYMEGVNTASAGSDERKYIMIEEDPVRMFLRPRAYTMDSISTTVHSTVFGGHGVEFVPWDGTRGVAWRATDFSFELFTLISMTLEHVLF